MYQEQLPLKYFVVMFFIVAPFWCYNQNAITNQEIITCGYDELETSLSLDQNYITNKLEYEKKYRKHISEINTGKQEKSANIVHRVPIVVHIIHDGATLGTDENPTDAMIFSQIQQASDRFRHQHAGAQTYTNPFYGVDTEIELCMAKIDPAGNFSSGVLRYYDPANAVLPTDPQARHTYLSSLMWDPNLYKNIFIAKDIGNACGIANSIYTWYLASCFNSGLICHEIGHYFSLGHPFNGGCNNNNCLSDGDFVCDTPPKSSPGTLGSQCSSPGNSCSTDEDDTSTNNPYRPVANGGIGDQPDMLANYMDYTGGCWDSFTQGQKDRMKFNITNSRMPLVNNSGVCDGNPIASMDIGISGISTNQSSSCESTIYPTATIYNYGAQNINEFMIHYYINGSLVHSQNVNVTIASGSSVAVNNSSGITLPFGNNLLSISTSLLNGNPDENTHNDTDYINASFTGGAACTNCETVMSFICPALSTTADQGHSTLNLGINHKYGKLIDEFGTVVDFNTAALTPVIAHSDNTLTGCETLWNNNAVTIKFQVSESGSYNLNFSNGSSSTLISVFDDSNFTCSSFVGSSGYETPTGSVSWFGLMSETLVACQDYWAVVYHFNGISNGNLFVSNNKAYTISSNPQGMNYLYLVYNVNTGVFEYLSNNSDFTFLPGGNFLVYGVSFDNSIDPDDLLGLSPSQLYNLPNCVMLSDNYYELIINSVSNCESYYSTLPSTPANNAMPIDQNTSFEYETNGTISSAQIISGANTFVEYDSGSFIELLQDFEVKLGAAFQAFIDGCGNLFKSEEKSTK